ncbi:MAG: adenylate/guanylate cyclase domain-containing protein [Chloroflexi bacterium]|nr:adenylate/guanylate cyclase domain-containing protein [Chloroflexota bacterium]MBM4451383.1 adenylate/guanylate cyclase domain-containing protein [Chloroflexota bacterium]
MRVYHQQTSPETKHTLHAAFGFSYYARGKVIDSHTRYTCKSCKPKVQETKSQLKSWHRNRLLRGLAIALSIGALFCIAFQFKLFYGTQLRASDFFFRAPGTQTTQNTSTIVVVAVDDTSLEQLGPFVSWSRSYHARLIDSLNKAQADVIVFDILFSEPTPFDDELALSVKAAGNVVFPIVGTDVKQGYTKPDNIIEYAGFAKPLKTLSENAATLGHANVLPDADGIVRRLPVVVGLGKDLVPALAVATAAEYFQLAQISEAFAQDNRPSLGSRLIPVDQMQRMLINYAAGSSGANTSACYQQVSYVDALKGKIDSAVFKDSIVIIGATATGFGDTFWTPTGQMMSGVEIHTHALNTILSGKFLSIAPPVVTILAIIVLSLLCGIAVLRFRVTWAVLSCVSLYITYVLTAFTLFDKGIMLDMLYPPLTILFGFLGATLYRVTLEQSDKREIAKLFGRYVPSQVANKLLLTLREEKLDLAGEQQEITVMFADIRGFTVIADRVKPEELVKVLNIYLSAVIEAVLKYDGMINKFGGDSIMAVWNVPTECQGHALLATKAAVDTQHAVNQLHKKETSMPQMDFGIGVNTGKAVAGNMGSEDRLEYTVIGEAVNLASRITSATPGGKVWIGADTFESTKGYVTAKQVKPLTVKGKHEPVAVYEVEGYVVDYIPGRDEQ